MQDVVKKGTILCTYYINKIEQRNVKATKKTEASVF